MADRTSVTEDDLRSILVSHAATADHRSGRLEEVHRRVSGLRRPRATSVVGLALAVVTVIVVMSLPAGHRPTTAVAPRPTVAPTAGSADLLPAYLRGGRLVAFTDQRTPTAAYLTFVPTSLAFGVVDGCSWANAPGGQSTPAARVTINGRTYEGSGCGVDGPLGLGGAGDMGRPSVDFANHCGIRVGRR